MWYFIIPIHYCDSLKSPPRQYKAQGGIILSSPLLQMNWFCKCNHLLLRIPLRIKERYMSHKVHLPQILFIHHAVNPKLAPYLHLIEPRPLEFHPLEPRFYRFPQIHNQRNHFKIGLHNPIICSYRHEYFLLNNQVNDKAMQKRMRNASSFALPRYRENYYFQIAIIVPPFQKNPSRRIRQRKAATTSEAVKARPGLPGSPEPT